MSSGTKFNPDREQLKQLLQEHNGKFAPVAKYLGVVGTTISAFVKKDPELANFLSEIRESYQNSLVEKAEGVFEFAMENKEEDLGNAMKAATYVCDNLGTLFGYGRIASDSSDELKRSFDALNSAIGAIHISEEN